MPRGVSPSVKEPIGVCVVVFNDKNQILLGKRRGGYKAGSYGLPGGCVDGAETLETAARRELTEETSITATDLMYVGVLREWQGTHSFIHFVYFCRSFTGTPSTTEPEKCEGWEWYDRNSLPTPLLNGHRAAVNLLASNQNMQDLTSA